MLLPTFLLAFFYLIATSILTNLGIHLLVLNEHFISASNSTVNSSKQVLFHHALSTSISNKSLTAKNYSLSCNPLFSYPKTLSSLKSLVTVYDSSLSFILSHFSSYFNVDISYSLVLGPKLFSFGKEMHLI